MALTLAPPEAREPSPVRSRRRVRRLPAAWPVYALFFGYPLWWVLGLQAFVWPLLAVPMAVSLLHRRAVRVPRGTGLLLLFLVWMVLSATQLDGPRQLLAFGFRASLYVSATVLLLYLLNLSDRQVHVPRLVQAAGFLWVATVVGGVAGLLLPGLHFASPLELVLPQGISQDPFVYSLVHLELSSESTLLGYSIPRPKAPFNYTNAWGSNLALLTFLAIYSLSVVRKRWWRGVVVVLLAVSIVPGIVSINRGLWLSLAVGAAYVGVRAAGRGRWRLLLGVLTAGGAVIATVLMSPLRQIVADRAENANVQGRAHLYEQAFGAALDSPVLGHGAPLPSDDLDLTANASIGTHGQLWTVLVSQGFVGLLLFVGFLAVTLLLTYRVSRRALWAHAVLVVALFQLPFYNALPVQLHIVVLAVALCWWDVKRHREAKGPTRARTRGQARS